MGSAAHSDSLSERLRQFSACDVSDAMLKLGHSHGGFVAGPVLWSPERQAGPTKIVGPAYTVKYRRPDGPPAAPKSASQEHYIDSVPAGSVILISAPDGVNNAVYGSLMTTRARAQGAEGTVVDGRIRDLDEHRNMQFPVFARGTGTASPYGVVVVEKINATVQVGNGAHKVSVRPGDYIVGDSNGVVCIPIELLMKVVEAMPAAAAADARIAEDLRQGSSFVEARARHRV